MKQFIEKVKQCHKTLKEARKKGNDADPGFIIKDTVVTVYIELIAFLNSVYLIKIVLDYVAAEVKFSDCVPAFAVIVGLNLLAIIVEAYRDNVMRTGHIHKLAKSISAGFYKKLIKMSYSEQFNSQTKDAAQFAYYNAAVAVFNSESIVSTYIGYLVVFIANIVTVIAYGSYMGFIILAVFFGITILLQKVAVKINKTEFDFAVKKNHLSRKFNYFRNAVFLNKQANQMLKAEDSLDYFLNRYEETLEEQKNNDVKMNHETFWLRMLKSRFFDLLYHVAYFAVFSFKLIVTGSLSIGSFWACYKACLLVFGSNVINYYGVMEQAARYVDQVNLFFLIDDEGSGRGTKKVDPDSFFEIVFEHVEFSYPGRARKVLKDINLTVKRGESIVILGENGAGKTTLLLLLYRLLKPTAGRILLNGIDIEEYDAQSYRNFINIQFQDFKLYPYPLAANIVLKNEYEEERTALKKCIDDVGLTKVVDRLENGMDTVVTRLFDPNGYVPSGGEASKIGFARQLINESGVFVFDEYDSNIDPISEEELNDRLLNMGKTRIIVSHRLSIAKDADRIYWIEKGKTVEVGTHKELCELGGKYAALYQQRKQLFLNEKVAI